MTKRQRLAAWYEKERRRAAVEVVTRRIRPQPQPRIVPSTTLLLVNHVVL